MLEEEEPVRDEERVVEELVSALLLSKAVPVNIELV